MPKLNRNFIICTRDVDRRGRFVAEPGDTRFLRVPKGLRSYNPSHEIKSRDRWRLAVRAAADGEEDEITGSTGDVLVFVHGYNNDMEAITWRTEALQQTLAGQGWGGLVLAFDWPSDNATLNYLDMEAFNQAQKKGKLFKADWQVSQVALIGGDISADSLRTDSEWASAMFARCLRLTNYSNRHDKVLGVSNAKRLGAAPRVGRVGLPEKAHRKAVNVDCSDYFATKDPARSSFNGTFDHSWHIGDDLFALDLALTMEGAIDRYALPTREKGDAGMVLRPGERPAFQPAWDAATPGEARANLGAEMRHFAPCSLHRPSSRNLTPA